MRILGMQDSPIYWIGATNTGDNLSFFWTVKGMEMKYSNWNPGQPNNKNNNEHCAVVISEKSLNGSNVKDCENKYNFICEKYQNHC